MDSAKSLGKSVYNAFGKQLHNPVSRVPVILVVSLLLVFLGFILYYMTGNRYAAQTSLVIEPSDLSIFAGQGRVVKQGFQVHTLATQGPTLIVKPRVDLFADYYSTVEWQIDGIEDVDVRFVWVSRDKPEITHNIPLTNTKTGSGTVDLKQHAHWQGFIQSVGLSITGTLKNPIFIREFRLENPQTPSISTLFGRLWNEWLYFEGWTQRSINFIRSTPRTVLFPPVLFVVTWIALALLLNSGWMLRHQQRITITCCGVFLLIGWLILDIRWQWHLSQQLAITRTQFADKSWPEKKQAEEDGALFQVMFEVKEQLPAQPVRLFLITNSDESNRYQRGRARYHLLPHNVYSSSRIPTKGIHANDYVLLLRPLQGIQYDPSKKALIQKNLTLPVELVHSSAMAGLFRVTSK